MAVHDDGGRTVPGSGQQGEKGSHGGLALQEQGEMSISLHDRNVKDLGWNSHGQFVKANSLHIEIE